MRRQLLLGITALFLALSAAGAHATPAVDQANLIALNQQAQGAIPGAALIEGRSAYDNGDEAPAVERREVGHAFRESPAIIVRNVMLLAVAGLVFGLGAAGAKALWVLDDTEASAHGWPRWFGY
jgi:hypothetical protein